MNKFKLVAGSAMGAVSMFLMGAAAHAAADADAVTATGTLNTSLVDTLKAIVTANIVPIAAVIALLLGIGITIRLVKKHAK